MGAGADQRSVVPVDAGEVMSPTAKRDTHGSETLLHKELQISSYNESIVLRSTELVL
jgi:hypothetical protein